MRASLSMRIATFLALAVTLAGASFAYAQESRSYHYSHIAADIIVNRDASINVAEALSYSFTGTYHMGYRSIPLNKIGSITDVMVFDESGKPLYYSSERLNKDDPESWGKYAVSRRGGEVEVEWYFDPGSDASYQRTWVIRYVAHGAVSFYTDHDELYWNVFSDFDVPVDTTDVTIHLPEADTSPQFTVYTNSIAYNKEQQSDRTFHLAVARADAHQPVTFALGWQKGLVSQRAYWLDWFKLNYAYLLAALILVGSILFDIVYWYFTERFRKGRGTIIPEYEPPRKLPPAMAHLIVKERLGRAVWPATIVDLAVRGYVKIIKEKRERLGGIMGGIFDSEGYRLERLKEFREDESLRKYEKQLLATLFEFDHDVFSTIDLKKKLQTSMTAAQSFQKRMIAAAKTLCKDTENDAHAYAVPLSTGMWKIVYGANALWRVFAVIFFAVIVFSDELGAIASVGSLMLGASVMFAVVGVLLTTTYNPRLNDDGFRPS